MAAGQRWSSSELIDVRLELSRRTITGPFCTNGICAREKKYVLIISLADSLHQEKIAIMTSESNSFDSNVVFTVDVEGEKAIGDVHHAVGVTTLRFAHWDRRVLMNVEYGSLASEDKRIITLTISRGDGHLFQWLGHEVEMVTLSAKLSLAETD